jgi:anti-sigma B factor antagonist
MFAITVNEGGEVVMTGRLDASQIEAADAVLSRLTTTTRIDFHGLEYISSAGLGVLLKTQKRLGETGQGLILTKMTKLVRDVFRYARFEVVFRIEDDV